MTAPEAAPSVDDFRVYSPEALADPHRRLCVAAAGCWLALLRP
jgi:hypothetical protein